MYKKLYSDLIPIVIGKMKEQLESGETAEEKTILSLEKIDKTWLVTDLEENRGGSAPAGTIEESSAAATTSSESAQEGSTPEQAAEFSTQQASEYATEETAQAEEPDLGDTGEDETAEEDLSEILPEDETTDSAENS